MDLDKIYYRVFNKKLSIPDKVNQFAILLTDGRSRFVSTIEKDSVENILIERVFGVRRNLKKKGKIEIEEVLRLRDDYKGCFCRNLRLTYCGYKPIWKDSKNSYYSCDEYQPNQIFEKCRIEYPNLSFTRLFEIKDIIELKPEYKYCCWDGYGFATEYLRRYKEQPYIEMLQKIGLGWYADKKRIINKLDDKAFRKFLYKESQAIRNNYLDVPQILKMYKGASLEKIIEDKEVTILKRRNSVFFKKYPMLNPIKVFRYITEQKTDFNNYKDLIEAVAFLKLDLNDTKNSYPHDFMKYHDLYTSQMSAVKNKPIDEGIAKMSYKYRKLLKTYGDITMVFPRNTNDFINEGSKLHHCVGRMGYNKKMAEGESLIIFIRHTEEIDKPFLTLELNPKNKTIKQFYGDHDKQPPREIDNLIRTVWINDIQKIRTI